MTTRIFCETPEAAERENNNPGFAPALVNNLGAAGGVVAFASAKGGVGKTALCVNIAGALAGTGRRVTVLDADLNSPGVLAALGAKALRRYTSREEIEPVPGPLGLNIVASNLIAEGEPAPFSFVDDDSTPALNGAVPVELDNRDTLRRLLKGALVEPPDLLLVDLASGLAKLHQLAKLIPISGVVIVNQPSSAATRAARNALEVIKHLGLPVIGIVENMVGFGCDSCHMVRPLFPQGETAALASSLDVAILGRLPFDPRLAESCDRGALFVRDYADTPLGRQIVEIAQRIDKQIARRNAPSI